MSTQSQPERPTNYEEGFLSQNTWLRPVGMFIAFCFGILSLIIISNAMMDWLGGRFGQVLFGMVASLIFMATILTVVLLLVNGTRYVINNM
jgi:hypothetical protein